MRYCKRTFFNKLFQPHRIGKPIFKVRPTPLVELDKPMNQTAVEETRNNHKRRSTILARFSKIRVFCLCKRHDMKIKYLHSKLVRRAKQNEFTE